MNTNAEEEGEDLPANHANRPVCQARFDDLMCSHGAVSPCPVATQLTRLDTAQQLQRFNDLTKSFDHIEVVLVI